MMTLLLFPAKKKLQPLPEHKHTRLGISRIQEKVSIQETEICPSVLNGLSSPLFHSSTPTAKSIHRKKANQTIHSPPPMGRQVCSHPWGSLAPSFGKTNPFKVCVPCPSFASPPLPKLPMISHSLEYPLGQLGSAMLAVSPPKFLSTLSSLLPGW